MLLLVQEFALLLGMKCCARPAAGPSLPACR